MESEVSKSDLVGTIAHSQTMTLSWTTLAINEAHPLLTIANTLTQGAVHEIQLKKSIQGKLLSTSTDCSSAAIYKREYNTLLGETEQAMHVVAVPAATHWLLKLIHEGLFERVALTVYQYCKH